MGACFCADKAPDEEGARALSPTPGPAAGDGRPRVPEVVNNEIVDSLVRDMMAIISTFVANDEESPVPLVKLHIIADKEDGWIQVVDSMVKLIKLEDPFGPSAITVLFDDCPLPSKTSVTRLVKIYDLSEERASAAQLNVRIERNICVVLGCIAEKLSGPNSLAVFTDRTLDYLLSFLRTRRDPSIVLYALVALEKFAHTTENKLTIRSRLDKEPQNPLLYLETLADSEEFIWRQVGFCAKWLLDNIFVVEGRTLSYELQNMEGINVMLNSRDVSEYLKISSGGLEARCDSYSFESVRCTFQVDAGCWYYEVQIITAGVMQIGWATKNSHFLNHDGYGIGDDLYSLAYDGCRRLVWHNAQAVPVNEVPAWRPGDCLGCLIDLDGKEVVFSLNGETVQPCREIFATTRYGFFAAASFMAFQQCRFNFGSEPFRHPPLDRTFFAFNDHGHLSDDEKKVVPRRLYIEQLLSDTVKEDTCTLCCDQSPDCILKPCGHRGFCSICTSQLKECPMCRAVILNVQHDGI